MSLAAVRHEYRRTSRGAVLLPNLPTCRPFSRRMSIPRPHGIGRGWIESNDCAASTQARVVYRCNSPGRLVDPTSPEPGTRPRGKPCREAGRSRDSSNLVEVRESSDKQTLSLYHRRRSLLFKGEAIVVRVSLPRCPVPHDCRYAGSRLASLGHPMCESRLRSVTRRGFHEDGEALPSLVRILCANRRRDEV